MKKDTEIGGWVAWLDGYAERKVYEGSKRTVDEHEMEHKKIYEDAANSMDELAHRSLYQCISADCAHSVIMYYYSRVKVIRGELAIKNAEIDVEDYPPEKQKEAMADLAKAKKDSSLDRIEMESRFPKVQSDCPEGISFDMSTTGGGF